MILEIKASVRTEIAPFYLMCYYVSVIAKLLSCQVYLPFMITFSTAKYTFLYLSTLKTNAIVDLLFKL